MSGARPDALLTVGRSRRVLLVGSDRTEAAAHLLATDAVEVHVAVKPKHAHHYPAGVHVHPVPDIADVTRVIAAARPLAVQGLDAVIAVQERALISAAAVRTYFGIPGPDLATVVGFADKTAMKTRLQAHGLPTAAFRSLARLADLPAAARALGTPVVLKPAVSAGAQNTWTIPDLAAAEAMCGDPAALAVERSGTGLLLERYVPMDAELHCDAVVEDGRAVALSVARYFSPLLTEVGGFAGSRTIADDDPVGPRVRRLHDRVVAALGLRAGVTHLEVYETGAGLVVGEITCRPAGGGVPEMVALKHGWTLWAALAATALGEPAAPIVDRRSDPRVVGWCGLPARNGRIIALTHPDDVAAVPGVESVLVHHRLGETVVEKQTSTFNTMVALFRVADEAEVALLRKRLQALYHIEVQPVPTSAPDDGRR